MSTSVFLDLGPTTSIVETASRRCRDDQTLTFSEARLLVNAVHRIATNAVVEPPWRRPLQAFRLAGLMRGILQSPLPDSNRRPRPYRGNPPSHGSRQCPRNAEFPASAASRDADASPLKVPRGGGPRGNPRTAPTRCRRWQRP